MAYLFNKPFIENIISITTVQSLFQESKEYRDNNHGLQSLSEDDKEDWNSEDVDSHCSLTEQVELYRTMK